MSVRGGERVDCDFFEVCAPPSTGLITSTVSRERGKESRGKRERKESLLKKKKL